MVPHTLTDTSLTVVINCAPHVLPSSHPNFARVVELLARGASAEEIEPLLNIPKAIEDFMLGNIAVRDRVVYYKGTEVTNYLASHIIKFMQANDPALAKPLIRFLDNVMENPSYRAVQGLFEWAQKSKLPITSDGHLLAWKIVGQDYKDLHSRRFDNSPGKIVEQPRNLCDEDADRTCSAGLHFCSYDYLPHYGSGQRDRIVIVKIHPRDVVAFPRDYNTSKGRCCRYEVVGEVPPELVREYFPENTYVWSGFDAAPEPEIEVGQYWSTFDGDIVQINDVDDDPDLTYPVEATLYFAGGGNGHATYTREGAYLDDGDTDGRDLEELLSTLEDVEIEVGQKWFTRDGTIVEVVGINDSGNIAELDTGFHVLTSNGDNWSSTKIKDAFLRCLVADA